MFVQGTNTQDCRLAPAHANRQARHTGSPPPHETPESPAPPAAAPGNAEPPSAASRTARAATHRVAALLHDPPHPATWTATATDTLLSRHRHGLMPRRGYRLIARPTSSCKDRKREDQSSQRTASCDAQGRWEAVNRSWRSCCGKVPTKAACQLRRDRAGGSNRQRWFSTRRWPETVSSARPAGA